MRCLPTPNTAPLTVTPESWDITRWWRCGRRPQEIVHSRLRGGSSQKGAAHFVVETVNRVRRAGAAGPVTVRADSGFWSYRLIADLDRLGVEWSITIPQYEQVKAAIANIEETEWEPIDYPKGGEAQVTETAFCASKKGKGRRVRMVVRRTRLTDPAQAQLWPDWRYHAFATNTKQPAVQADRLSPGTCPHGVGNTRPQTACRSFALPLRELLRHPRLAFLRHPGSQPLPVDRTPHPPDGTTNQRKTPSAPACSHCPQRIVNHRRKLILRLPTRWP